LDAAIITITQARGLALERAKGARIRHIAGDVYFVPSVTSTSGYVVNGAANTCSCAAHEESGAICKHQWALRYHRHDAEVPEESTAVTVPAPPLLEPHRLTYGQSWSDYNHAQCEEKERVRLLLRGLCDGIIEPVQTRGRPRIPLGDAIYCATMKVYTTVSGRRATTDLKACETSGLVKKAAHYNSVFRTIERADLKPLLKQLVEQSATPLRAIEKTFAADSTGLATNTYSRWFEHAYGEPSRKQRWVKLHAMVGTFTNVITAVEVTESYLGDAPMLIPLLDTTLASGFNVREVCADKAYLSNDNLIAIEAAGAEPFIPFKSNSTPAGNSEVWRRLHHGFEFNREDFSARYHQRSNVEATFSALKRKFGAAVRSRLPAAQLNEALLMCLCFNLSRLVHVIHVLGVEPQFWLPVPKKVMP